MFLEDNRMSTLKMNEVNVRDVFLPQISRITKTYLRSTLYPGEEKSMFSLLNIEKNQKSICTYEISLRTKLVFSFYFNHDFNQFHSRRKNIRFLHSFFVKIKYVGEDDV